MPNANLTLILRVSLPYLPTALMLHYRQAALEALQVVLEAFSQEDHFAAVAGPLLATPLQHTQAAASTSGQVSCAVLCCVVLCYAALCCLFRLWLAVWKDP